MQDVDTARRPGELPEPERIAWLEDRGWDFPYYRGSPVSLVWTDWTIVLAALAAGFAILTTAPARPPFSSTAASS